MQILNQCLNAYHGAEVTPDSALIQSHLTAGGELRVYVINIRD